MSKIGNHRVGLQEHPCYEDGYRAFDLGIPRDYVEDGQPYYAEDNAAWQLGWDDAKAAHQPEGAMERTMTDILELAERVEAHTGGDSWALRVEIATALGWVSNPVGGVIAWYSPDEPERMRPGPPKWLTSIDAAMTLVPDGWSHGCRWNHKHQTAQAWCEFIPEPPFAPEELLTAHSGKCKSPALALTAAALRAGETK